MPNWSLSKLFSTLPTEGTAHGASSDLPPYQYASLPTKSSIRLLELKAVEKNEPICSLTTFELYNETPPFDALSYTWGNPYPQFSAEWSKFQGMDREYPITCDKKTLSIRANLRHALDVLSQSQSGTSFPRQRYIWIDSICINQKDNTEKSAQVSLMADIYQMARAVLVWIGGVDEFSSDAFSALKQFSGMPSNAHELITAEDWWNQEDAFRSKLGIQPASLDQWLGLLAFFNRQFFKRAWVVQEIVLSKRAEILCGSSAVPFNQVSTLVSFLTKTGWYEHLHTGKLRNTKARRVASRKYHGLLDTDTDFGMAAMYLEQNKTNIELRGKPPLRYILQTHRHTEAADSRDKIFAFLGLGRVDRAPFTAYKAEMVPDYDLCDVDVYTRITKAFHRSYGDLRMLEHVQIESLTAIKSLPSWVPDFSVLGKPDPLSINGYPAWNAAKDLKWTPDSRQLVDPLLGVQGLCIGSIEEATIMADETADPNAFWESVVKIACKLPDYYQHASDDTSKQSRAEALWRTVIRNSFTNEYPAPSNTANKFFSWMAEIAIQKMIWEAKDRISRFKLPNTSLGQGFGSFWLQLLDKEPADSRFDKEAFLNLISGKIDWTLHDARHAQMRYEIDFTIGGWRRLFRSKNGFLGVGARTLRVGDEIWILAGKSTPVILRSLENGHFKFVGEAYVHGIMHGEGLEFGLERRAITLE